MRTGYLSTSVIAGAVVVSLVAGSTGPAAEAVPESKPWAVPPTQVEPSVPGVDFKPRHRPVIEKTTWPAPAPKWPVTGSPAITITPGYSARVLDRQQTASLGVVGVIVGVRPDLVGTTSHPPKLRVDYSGFAHAMGGDWATRLRIFELDCATARTCRTARLVAGGVNDTQARTVTGTTDLGRSSAPGSERLFAIAAGPSGGNGSFEATSLAPSSTWQVGLQTGDFTWSYPMRVPPVTYGTAPTVGISYSAGSIDGRTASTNNQPSWIGEGHGLEPGFVERKYVSCADDMKPVGGETPNNANHKTGDLCWKGQNATLVLGGRSTDLIKIASGWKLKNDDGSKIEQFIGAPNDARSGEYWRFTTSDGTQYHFGVNPIGYGTTRADSVSTVPVFGNHPGETCYVSGNFAASYTCGGDSRSPGWRWSLDYVVDRNGNTTTYRYVQEDNYYGRNLNTGVSKYQRGSWLSLIEYGERTGTDSGGAPPARVTFGVAERCIPEGAITCAPEQLTAANAHKWPDVPFDQICSSSMSCPNRTSPTFFGRKRLVEVNTEVWNGSAMRPVDTWLLRHVMKDPGDGTTQMLWLTDITHQGRVGGTATLAPVTFIGVPLPNRVGGFDTLARPMNKFRIQTIRTESGAAIDVKYSAAECSETNKPSSEATNGMRCFPAQWTPPDYTEPKLDWFHKYVVTQVSETDLNTDAPIKLTSYEYLGAPAWHYNENELIPEKYRTWSEFRGYNYVYLRTGHAGWQTQVRSLFMRGMHGDRLEKTGAQRKTVTVTDSNGGVLTDVDPLNGYLREQITYDGFGGPEITGTINSPWLLETGSSPTGEPAHLLETQATRTRTKLTGGTERVTGVNTAFDAYGMPTEVNDLGDVALGNDDRCTRYSYARNVENGVWITGAVSRAETVSVSCVDTTPDRATQLVSDVRTYYDGHAGLADKPTRALPTRTEAAKEWSGGPVYVPRTRTDYDTHGRVLRTYDGLGRMTKEVAYTQANATAPVTEIITTDAKDYKARKILDPAWGLPVIEVNANNGRTESTYDPLGRLTAAWLPDRSKAAGATPTVKFEYLMRTGAPNVVTTYSLLPSGSYTTSKTLYDGLLRPRQTQSHTATGIGRLVTDTFYTSRGVVDSKSDTYYNADVTGPTDTLFKPWPLDIPARTVFTYDGTNRETNAILKLRDAERWRTTTTYDGDRVKVVPPVGGTVTEKLTDARGKVSQVREYHGRTATTYAATNYTFTPRDELASVTDSRGTVWRYSYDLLGRKTSSVDPDTGTSTSTYDDADRVTSSRDARGQVLAMEYDELNRKTAVRKDSSAGAMLASWTYDTLRIGQLTSSTRFVGGSAYVTAITGYDAIGRATGTSMTIPPVEGRLAGTYTTSTSYKPDGSVFKQTMPQAPGVPPTETLETIYSAAGKPEALLGYQGYVVGADYLPQGEPVRYNIASTYGKSVFKFMDYEIGTRRLSAIRVSRENLSGEESFAYTYDDASNVTSITQVGYGATDRQCFTTDYLRRVVEAWTPTGACSTAPSVAGLGGAAPYWQSFSYDGSGSRTKVVDHKATGDTTRTYTYPAASAAHPHAVGSITSTGATTGTDSYGYDAAGHLTSRTEAGQSDTFMWDEEGRLGSVSGASGATSMLYTADGARLIRRDPGGATLYLPSTEIRWDRATDQLSSTRFYSFNGTPVAMRTGVDKAEIVVTDKYGTMQIGIDAYTQAYSRRRSDLFGNIRQQAGPWEPTSHGFVDGVIDSSTRLTHLGAREYDPKQGRFISVDPIIDPADPQQMNGYAYGNNNPATFTDPDGLKDQEDSGGGGAPSTGGTGGTEGGEDDDEGRQPDPPEPQDQAPSEDDDRERGWKGHAKGFWKGIKKTGKALAVAPVHELRDEVSDARNCVTGDWMACYETVNRLNPSSIATDMVTGTAEGGKSIYSDAANGRGGEAAGTATVYLAMLLGTRRVMPVKPTAAASKTATTAPVKPRPTMPVRAAKACSFTGATLVLMADGSKRPIMDVKVGDQVMAADPETQESGPRRVAHVFAHDDIVFDFEVGGKVIETTEDHPFWNATDRQFQRADRLDPGDRVLSADGRTLPVGRLVDSSGRLVTAHNLAVDDLHTYFVLAGDEPVLVHNSSAECGIDNLRHDNFLRHRAMTAKGEVEMTGMVRINGTRLHISDVAVYGRGGMTRGSVGTSVVIRELRQTIAPAAARQGFTELRITAERVSGNVGHEVDFTIKLDDY